MAASTSTPATNAAIGAAVVGGVVLGLLGASFLRSGRAAERASASSSSSSAPVASSSAPAASDASSGGVVPTPSAAATSTVAKAGEAKRATNRSFSPDRGTKRQLALVVVDPISTGANLCDEIMKRKIPCIRVFSSFVPPSLSALVAPGLLHDFVETLHDDDANFNKTVQSLLELPYTIHAVIAGSELAIELADKLSERLGVRSNGSETSFLRRDKFQMGEAVRRSGVRAVKQARVQTWLQIENFLARHDPQPFQVVIKPIRSAGSDGVSLCKDKEHLQKCMSEIVGHTNKMGMSNYAAVVQEYLEGHEYVVDTVSRDGVHKLAAIWKYDKRKTDTAAFVYFGMRSVDPKSHGEHSLEPLGERLFNYQKLVLDALGIQHGPGHGEIIDTKTGPVLVECGARPHGAEGTFMPIADEVFGRNQVKMTADCYSDSKRFEEYEAVPRLRKHGLKIDLVSSVTGTLRAFQHKEEIQKLASFTKFDMLPSIGDHIPVTVDCFTAVGSVSLCHESADIVEADHLLIREFEKTFFIVSDPVHGEESKSSAKLVA